MQLNQIFIGMAQALSSTNNIFRIPTINTLVESRSISKKLCLIARINFNLYIYFPTL